MWFRPVVAFRLEGWVAELAEHFIIKIMLECGCKPVCIALSGQTADHPAASMDMDVVVAGPKLL